jgi:hypothetical protein
MLQALGGLSSGPGSCCALVLRGHSRISKDDGRTTITTSRHQLTPSARYSHSILPTKYLEIQSQICLTENARLSPSNL